MKKILLNSTRELIKGFCTKKTLLRLTLLTPVFLYVVGVIFWVSENKKSNAQNEAISLTAYEMNLDTEALLDETLAGYDDASTKEQVGFTNTLMTNQFFTGQGGYDSLVPYTSNTEVFPRDWIEEIHTQKEFPNLTYHSYRIQEGDMIGVIADRFGITQDTLISVNNIRQTRLIQIGEYLRIPSMPGILYTVKQNGETPNSIAEKYEVSPDKTAAVNGMEKLASLEEGRTIFIPDAILDWVTVQEINGDLFRIPLRNRYYISSYFGWRNSPFTGERSYHGAIDMAAPRWTPIYGALIGTVTTVRYGDPVYGHYVVVTHHSGYTTLYAHMVDINVYRGEVVDTNSILGWVGSTGMSTGDHLHFAILKYGSAINPINLWN